MFGQVMKNSALCAKVHAMTGRALSDDDYRALLNMKSVQAVASYLVDNTGYARALEGVSPAAFHRGALERRLREYLKSDIESLIPFMNSGMKKFMGLIALEDGISKVKVCLRLIRIGHAEQTADYLSESFDLGLPVSSDTLAEVKTMDEFIELLRGSPYYPALHIFKGKTEQQKLFAMEMALDTYWAKLVCKYAKRYLPPNEAKAVLKLQGMKFDMENLTFLLRCKKNFDMPEEEIYASVIPQYYRLSEETISRIVKSSSYDDALVIISEETPYGKAFSKDDRFIEKRENEYMSHIHRHIYNTNQYSVQSPLYYIHLRRTEIDNIVSIIEGIRYGLEPVKIESYLIGYGRGESKT